MPSAQWACRRLSTMTNSIQISSEPLEGTPLLGSPVPARSTGWEAAHTWAFPSCRSLTGLHRQAREGQRPESQHTWQGAPSLASAYRSAPTFYWRLICSAREWWGLKSPLLPAGAGAAGPSASDPCLSFAPGEYHTAFRLPTLQGLFWSKKQSGLTLSLLISNHTQEYQTPGVYLLILRNQNPTLFPVNSPSAGGMSIGKWKDDIKASKQ